MCPSLHEIPDDRNLQFVFFLFFYSQLIYFNLFNFKRLSNNQLQYITNLVHWLRWASSKDCLF